MTLGEPEEITGPGLARLPVHDISPERIERIRSACVSELARRSQRADAFRETAVRRRGRLEMAVAAGLGALYLAGALERALEIFS